MITKKNDFQDSRKTSEYRNRAYNASQEAEKLLKDIKNISNEISLLGEKIEIDRNSILNQNESIESIKLQFEEKISGVSQLMQKLEIILEKHPGLEVEIDNFKNDIEEIDELNTKINAIHTNSAKKKKEIDELYYEINGHTNINEETGKDEIVDGLKQKLEKTYNEVKINFEDLKNSFELYEETIETDLKELKEEYEKEYSNTEEKWEGKFSVLEKKIADLLPDALTAGLSSAYSEKKSDEAKDLIKLTNSFNIGIILLILVSLIPFIISIILLLKGTTLIESIEIMPRLVVAILPLYIPIGWFTYSANKKINLSKRLIEEYTHKEVLSKTFEGLSTQISSLDESETSKELKMKLLTNILDVSAENPGKLISDYNSSDHPIIDALNKSEKLSRSINRLEKIPGLHKVADFLKNTSEKVIDKKSTEIIEALDEVTKIVK